MSAGQTKQICWICRRPIELGVEVVSSVGGHFPKEEPDFFLADPTVMVEVYAHGVCFRKCVFDIPTVS
jgi:hypothetical protein